MPGPAPSVPDQLSAICGPDTVDGRAATLLVGGPASMVFRNVFVTIGALMSNTTLAWALICVPVARPVFGLTVYDTKPAPSGGVLSGGRKPRSGLAGMSRVAGSSAAKVHVTVRVATSSAALTSTNTPSVLRASIRVE